jgi:hypothetical protein
MSCLGQIRRQSQRFEHHSHPKVSTGRALSGSGNSPDIDLRISSCDLPDDVFAPGEVKPSRPQKKKTPTGAKKRSATDVRRMYTIRLTEIPSASGLRITIILYFPGSFRR